MPEMPPPEPKKDKRDRPPKMVRAAKALCVVARVRDIFGSPICSCAVAVPRSAANAAVARARGALPGISGEEAVSMLLLPADARQRIASVLLDLAAGPSAKPRSRKKRINSEASIRASSPGLLGEAVLLACTVEWPGTSDEAEPLAAKIAQACLDVLSNQAHRAFGEAVPLLPASEPTDRPSDGHYQREAAAACEFLLLDRQSTVAKPAPLSRSAPEAKAKRATP